MTLLGSSAESSSSLQKFSTCSVPTCTDTPIAPKNWMRASISQAVKTSHKPASHRWRSQPGQVTSLLTSQTGRRDEPSPSPGPLVRGHTSPQTARLKANGQRFYGVVLELERNDAKTGTSDSVDGGPTRPSWDRPGAEAHEIARE
jgi:hypothetical protein